MEQSRGNLQEVSQHDVATPPFSQENPHKEADVLLSVLAESFVDPMPKHREGVISAGDPNFSWYFFLGALPFQHSERSEITVE